MDKELEQGAGRKQTQSMQRAAWAPLVAQCGAGGSGDAGSTPGSDLLAEEAAAHCSMLAWGIPWTRGSRGLQSWTRRSTQARPRTNFLTK